MSSIGQILLVNVILRKFCVYYFVVIFIWMVVKNFIKIKLYIINERILHIYLLVIAFYLHLCCS